MLLSVHHEASVEDVDHLAQAAAGMLAAGGVGVGALVGLAAVNGPGFLAGFLAIRRAGGAALLFDGHTPEAEKIRIASSLGATAMLNSPRAWPQDENDFMISPVEADSATRRHTEKLLTPDVAVVKLTSGSTGAPRGIITPSAALVADDAALTSTMGLADNERILAAIPMSHSYGLSSVVMPALMRDAVLVLSEEANPFAPLVVARDKKVTFLPTAPAYLQAIVKMSNPPPLPDCLRLVISAGAPLKSCTATRFQEVFGQPVHVFYGASECGGISFDRTGNGGQRGSLGTPVDGVRIELEPIQGQETDEPGTDGRCTVSVASGAVARCYLPDTDPGLSEGRFRTRDLGVFRVGELFLGGRLDQMINVRGKKVNPREVEAVLSRLDGVEEAVTLGILPPGADEKIVRCFVACQSGRLTHETVQTWCRRHLAEHKVPRSIVLLDEIPKTPRGKLDRAALLKLGPEND